VGFPISRMKSFTKTRYSGFHRHILYNSTPIPLYYQTTIFPLLLLRDKAKKKIIKKKLKNVQPTDLSLLYLTPCHSNNTQGLYIVHVRHLRSHYYITSKMRGKYLFSVDIVNILCTTAIILYRHQENCY
jgi:hypothetical protein